MDFRPLFIAPALRCLDTVFNVNKQRYAALLFGSFRRLCALALYPFFDCFLCIICTEGFKRVNRSCPGRGRRYIFPALSHSPLPVTAATILQNLPLGDKRINGNFQLAFPTCTDLFRLIFCIAFSPCCPYPERQRTARFPGTAYRSCSVCHSSCVYWNCICGSQQN